MQYFPSWVRDQVERMGQRYRIITANIAQQYMRDYELILQSASSW
jgi:hypothetical protein